MATPFPRASRIPRCGAEVIQCFFWGALPPAPSALLQAARFAGLYLRSVEVLGTSAERI